MLSSGRQMRILKILIVDDDVPARRALRSALVAHGFAVRDAATGEEALQEVQAEAPDIVLLDLGEAGGAGLTTCRAIRGLSEAPLLALSRRNSAQDRVDAFEAGADQFIVKPCDLEELIARIRAAQRRIAALRSHLLFLGDVEVNLESREVKRKDGVAHLTAKEFKVLQELAAHPGEVVSHRAILQAVWGPEYGEEVEYLRVFINQLRKKVEPDPGNPAYILTEPSAGYRLALPRREGRRDQAGGMHP